MTGDLLIDTLISITAIAVLVLIARLVFPSPAVSVTKELAVDRLALDEPDFTPHAWLIDMEGRAALAQGATDEFVLVKRLGLDLATRRFRAGLVKAVANKNVLTIELHDATLPKVVFSSEDAMSWRNKLTSNDGA